jgi:pilus assembly protein CpaF
MIQENTSTQLVDQFELEDHLHQLLSNTLEGEMEAGELDGIPNREELTFRVRHILDAEKIILPKMQHETLIDGVVDRIIGLGPLQPLMQDPTITEIMVNNARNVFIERGGKIQKVEVVFRDDAHLRHVIDRIVAPIGKRVDESSPMVDARLPDGSRVNAIIPPLAIGGPALTIRKFSRRPFTLDRLTSLGTINAPMAAFLRQAVVDRQSMILSGGTGSGKTTTLNALGACIPAGERIITIEDSAELHLEHSDLVSLESRPPNIEGTGEIPIRTLVRNALRMRPDRIIVGEVRGGEAFDMLQAMNTGHRGSLTTLHANSPDDAIVRLESMVLMAGFDMPLTAIRRMITGAIQLVLQQDRHVDGRRIITDIAELSAVRDEGVHLISRFRYDLVRETHLEVGPTQQ